MGESGIMNYLRTDKELLEMRKKWKELGIDYPFPPFNYDEYNGTDGYKETLRKVIDEYDGTDGYKETLRKLIDDYMKHSMR